MQCILCLFCGVKKFVNTMYLPRIHCVERSVKGRAGRKDTEDTQKSQDLVLLSQKERMKTQMERYGQIVEGLEC